MAFDLALRLLGFCARMNALTIKLVIIGMQQHKGAGLTIGQYFAGLCLQYLRPTSTHRHDLARHQVGDAPPFHAGLLYQNCL
jgi:hypothetical protein